jgi:hypothetical protein
LRDIDQIIARLRAEIPGVQIEQLRVVHTRADDDGLWFIRIPGRIKVQIESSNGACPFLIEWDLSAERFHGHSIDEVVSTVRRLCASV